MIETKGLAGLDWLAERFGKLVEAAVGAVRDVVNQADDFAITMQHLLMRYHTAAYMTGTESTDLTPAAADAIKARVADQDDYLQQFVDDMKAGEMSPDELAARAQLYTGSIRATYWHGTLEELPLPYWPAEDTECLTNCLCRWRLETLDSTAGDFDVYWELGHPKGKNEHCQTCLDRASESNPFRIRGWEPA